MYSNSHSTTLLPACSAQHWFHVKIWKKTRQFCRGENKSTSQIHFAKTGPETQSLAASTTTTTTTTTIVRNGFLRNNNTC
jgi:hypothetical protein